VATGRIATTTTEESNRKKYRTKKNERLRRKEVAEKENITMAITSVS